MTDLGQNVVWVLMQEFPYAGEGLFGVYSSKEDAERARDAGKKHLNAGDNWVLYEVEVDAAARWYAWNDREENRDDA